MQKISTCLSPALLHLYDVSDQVVVVTDVLRATSAIAEALNGGATEIMPFADLNKCKAMQQYGYIIAAERDGKVVSGFEIGNSPLGFKQMNLISKKIALTTTNGTKAIEMAMAAKAIYTGALTHISALANHLLQLKENVLIVCAGWKDTPCLEDTLFAGALANQLQHKGYELACDSSFMAKQLYLENKNNLFESVKNASHFKRLAHMGIVDDIAYCMQEDIMAIIPKYEPSQKTIKAINI